MNHSPDRTFQFLVSICFLAFPFLNCNEGDFADPNKVPHIYLGFEREIEPFQEVSERKIDPSDQSNGCVDGALWNEYYTMNVCVAPTCPLSDFALERSQKYTRSGQSSLRVFLRPTPLHKWPLGEATHRAELSPYSKSPVAQYPKENEERWYGMSVLFPTDFVFAPKELADELRFIIAQWHHGTEGSPIFAFEVHGDRIGVGIATRSGESTNSIFASPQYIAKIVRGEWMDLVVQIRWSKNNGMINVWVNNQQKIKRSAVQTIYDDLDVGGGLKVGIYYWRWHYRESVRKSLEAGINYREIFIDEVRQYIGPNGFSAVNPGNPF